MMKNIFYTVLILLISGFSGFAQDIPKCIQHKEQQELLEKYPQIIEQVKMAKEQLEAESVLRGSGGDGEVLIIPMVFHIIHDYGPENISDEQVYDAVEILNRDFRKMNFDTLQIIDEFADLAADIRIEFRLAQLDPDGNCTKGITRTVSDLTYEGNAQMRHLVQWPRDQYMNIWVCNYANGAAGYTFNPSYLDNVWAEDDDGIVLKHNYTGSIGSSSSGNSRTLTHEVGHWLNLSHTWGSTNDPGLPENCNSDDGVSDTPLTMGWTTCNIYGESCGSLDNVQNYMEYSYCSRMFTEGQKARMRTAAQSNIAERNQLHTEANLVATGVYGDIQLLCEADFTVNKRVVCAGAAINFDDESFNAVDYWTWEFGDGTVVEGGDAEQFESIQYIYNEAGTYTVTLTVEKDGTTETRTRIGYIEVLPSTGMALPIEEGFEEGFQEEEWIAVGGEDEIGWEVTSAAAYSGSESIFLNNRVADPGQLDQLITRTINASDTNGIEISFRYAYANVGADTPDELKVSISGDCGENWTAKKLRRGDTNLPTAEETSSIFVPDGTAEWDEISFEVSEPEFLTENFMIRFAFTGAGGNNIYIDNINISSLFTSIEELSQDVLEWEVYPNPTEGNASLRMDVKEAGLYKMSVWDITGRKIIDIHEGNLPAGEKLIQVPANQLRDGIYMIVVESNHQRSTKRLMIRH